MDDILRPALKIGVVVGLGMLSGYRPDGQPIMYRGGIQRFHVPKGENAKPYFEKFSQQIVEGFAALQQRSDIQPAEGAAVELAGCCDAQSDDIVLMWRVPCIQIVTH